MISQLRWKTIPVVGRRTRSCSELALKQKGRGRMNVSIILNAWFYILFIDLLMTVRYSHETWLGSRLYKHSRVYGEESVHSVNRYFQNDGIWTPNGNPRKTTVF